MFGAISIRLVCRWLIAPTVVQLGTRLKPMLVRSCGRGGDDYWGRWCVWLCDNADGNRPACVGMGFKNSLVIAQKSNDGNRFRRGKGEIVKIRRLAVILL